MKQLLQLISLSVFFVACNNETQQQNPTKGFSQEQKKLYALTKRHEQLNLYSANDLERDEWQKKYLDSADHYLSDSLKNQLNGFNVQVKEVDVKTVGDQYALVASFEDNDGNEHASLYNTEYWVEIDVAKDSADKMKSSGIYKALMKIKEKRDTTLDFFYMGNVEWDISEKQKLRVRVVPIPKGSR